MCFRCTDKTYFWKKSDLLRIQLQYILAEINEKTRNLEDVGGSQRTGF